MWFNVYYVWKAFILNYSMAEKCGQIEHGRKMWSNRQNA